MSDAIKCILFDLDDTLLIEWKSAEKSFLETIELVDHIIDKSSFVQIIREEARKLWYSLPTIDYCKKVGISSWEALWADFTGEDKNLKILHSLAKDYRISTWTNALKRYDINPENTAARLSEEFKKIRSAKHILFDESIETLEKLKYRYKLGLITNGAPDLQWKKVIGGKLRPYFDSIIISGEYGYAKPDTRLFRVAIDSLKTEKNTTIMVGDNLNTDINGGKNAGIQTAWVNRDKKEANENKPDIEIDNLLQLVEIIDSR